MCRKTSAQSLSAGAFETEVSELMKTPFVSRLRSGRGWEFRKHGNLGPWQPTYDIDIKASFNGLEDGAQKSVENMISTKGAAPSNTLQSLKNSILWHREDMKLSMLNRDLHIPRYAVSDKQNVSTVVILLSMAIASADAVC